MNATWRSRLLAALGLLLMVVASVPALVRAAVPTGFTDTVVASVTQPIDLAVVAAGPQAGTIYVTSKSGVLNRIPVGSDTAQTALNLEVRTCDEGERGMLGVALDPEFGNGSSAIYLYYTVRAGECFNRVSRFMVRANGSVNPASEQVLIQTARLEATNHNGGDLGFGLDGNLYISIGDNARSQFAQRKNTYFGKILRITTDGNPASGNPYRTTKDAVACGVQGRAKKAPCAEVFALGLRNPFRFAFEPNSNRFLINDVGQSTWEEIDRGRKGANYGWPLREGPCLQGQSSGCAPAPATYTDPIFSYSHDTGCDSITAGAFVPDGNGWPAEYQGEYLYADFICEKMFTLSSPFSTDPVSAEFADGMGPVIDVLFDPTDPGSLLYTELYSDSGGKVHRVKVE